MKKIILIASMLCLSFAGTSTSTFSVEGMMCAKGCAGKVNKAIKSVEGVKTMPEMVMTFVALDMGYDKETILTNLGVSEKYLDDLMKRITVCVNTNEKKFIRKVRLVRNYLKWNHRINF